MFEIKFVVRKFTCVEVVGWIAVISTVLNVLFKVVEICVVTIIISCVLLFVDLTVVFEILVILFELEVDVSFVVVTATDVSWLVETMGVEIKFGYTWEIEEYIGVIIVTVLVSGSFGFVVCISEFVGAYVGNVGQNK